MKRDRIKINWHSIAIPRTADSDIEGKYFKNS
jgi:hypothetical protein